MKKMMVIMMMMMMMIDIPGHLRLEMCNCATCGGAFGLRNFSSNLNVQPNVLSTTYSPKAVLQPNVKRTAQCHRLYLNCEFTSPSTPHTIAVTVGICVTKAINRLLSALGGVPPRLGQYKSAPSAIPFDAPVTGMDMTTFPTRGPRCINIGKSNQ